VSVPECDSGLRKKKEVIPMNPIVKIAVAVLVAALIVVIGLIVISNNAGNEIPKAEATAVPAIQATATPEATQQPEEVKTTEEPVQAADQAQNEEAQVEEMYEGALAGMTEEEIARQALAEEQSHGTETESDD
jgi:hypothetical protein